MSGGGSNLPLASAFAQWPDNLVIDLLEKYKELYMVDGNFSNFTTKMWKDIMEHINAKCIESGFAFMYSTKHVNLKIDSLKKSLL